MPLAYWILSAGSGNCVAAWYFYHLTSQHLPTTIWILLATYHLTIWYALSLHLLSPQSSGSVLSTSILQIGRMLMLVFTLEQLTMHGSLVSSSTLLFFTVWPTFILNEPIHGGYFFRTHHSVFTPCISAWTMYNLNLHGLNVTLSTACSSSRNCGRYISRLPSISITLLMVIKLTNNWGGVDLLSIWWL